MRITVFTPAYNRGYIIENLYHSLRRQTFLDFEWVVVDDGSIDNTQTLFARLCAEENTFPIRYVKTVNGGKHRAINKGMEMAAGELFFIVDSDDYITDDALEWIDRVERSIPESEKAAFGGVCGVKAYASGGYIGTTFDGEYLDITMLEREANGITGDKAEVIYTELMRKYRFPTFDGENFMAEGVVWDRIAADGYKLRFFNQASIICEYREDGLTAKGESLFIRNPKGYGLYLSQRVDIGLYSLREKWDIYVNYYYSMKATLSFLEISENLNRKPLPLWLGLLVMRVINWVKEKGGKRR